MTPSSRPAAPPSVFFRLGLWIRQHPLALGLLTALTLALLSEMPWLSRPVRAYILRGTIVAFFVLISAAGPYRENLRRAALRGPNPWILALLAWCVVSAVFAPYHAFATAELLRLFFCAGVYFLTAYCLRAGDLRPVSFGVLGLGAAVACYSAFQYSASTDISLGGANGIFGNHEQFGSFIALLLTVAAALALGRSGSPKALLGAQALSVILGGALLIARTRAAWIGELCGLVTLTVLLLRSQTGRLTRTNKVALIGPALILCLGFTLLVFSHELAPLLSQRLATFTGGIEDASFADRLNRWRGACRMAYERPLTGWGLGSFPVIESRWTHEGDLPAEVLAHGTGHSNLAHNFWVQWAAETGGVGLFLYVGMVASFLLSAGRALSRMPSGFPRSLLIGCLAATVTAGVDMIGAPSYTFPGVAALPWLWMGLGICACRVEAHEEALPPTPTAVWLLAAGIGLAAALLVLGIGSRQPPGSPQLVRDITQEQRKIPYPAHQFATLAFGKERVAVLGGVRYPAG